MAGPDSRKQAPSSDNGRRSHQQRGSAAAGSGRRPASEGSRSRDGEAPRQRGGDRQGQQRSRRREVPAIRTRDTTRETIKRELGDGSYIVFDIETTGGNPEKNGITEICALRYEGGKIVDRMCTLVNPKVPIPPIVRRMTGINDRMVRNAPPIEEVMPKFLEFAKHDVLVSHNTIGDLKFIRYFAKEACQHNVDNFFVCTHLLADKLANESPDKSLTGLGKFFKLESKEEMHRAEADAELTLRLLEVLIQRLKKRKIWTIEEAIRLQGDYESGYRIGWSIPESVLANVPQTPGVVQLQDSAGRVLFVCSAMNGQREVRKLRKYDQLPRPIFRQIVRAVELEYTLTDSRFNALADEAAQRAKHRCDLDPSMWHQRAMTTINLVKDDDGVRLVIGQPCEGAIGVFGPVRDRKAAQAQVDELANILALESDKKGLLIPKDWVEPIGFLLCGRLQQWAQARQGSGRSLISRIFDMFSSSSQLPPETLQDVGQIRIPASWQPLSNLAGVVEIKGEGRSVLHVIEHAKVARTMVVKADWLEGGPKGGYWKDFLRRHNKRPQPPLRTQPMKVGDAYFLNVLLWWIYSASNRPEGSFHTVEHLARPQGQRIQAATK